MLGHTRHFFSERIPDRSQRGLRGLEPPWNFGSKLKTEMIFLSTNEKALFPDGLSKVKIPNTVFVLGMK